MATKRRAGRRQRCTSCKRLVESTDTFVSKRTGRLVRKVCDQCSLWHRAAATFDLPAEQLPMPYPQL